MKALWMSAFLFLSAQVVHAEPVETEIFKCTSEVQGFENFRVTQTADSSDATVKPFYQLKTGVFFFGEEWKQVGDITWAPQETTVFQGEFSRKSTPILPLPTPENPNPEPTEEEEFLIYVSMNSKGTGSLSVSGDLAPISCTRSF